MTRLPSILKIPMGWIQRAKYLLVALLMSIKYYFDQFLYYLTSSYKRGLPLSNKDAQEMDEEYYCETSGGGGVGGGENLRKRRGVENTANSALLDSEKIYNSGVGGGTKRRNESINSGGAEWVIATFTSGIIKIINDIGENYNFWTIRQRIYKRAADAKKELFIIVSKAKTPQDYIFLFCVAVCAIGIIWLFLQWTLPIFSSGGIGGSGGSNQITSANDNTIIYSADSTETEIGFFESVWDAPGNIFSPFIHPSHHGNRGGDNNNENDGGGGGSGADYEMRQKVKRYKSLGIASYDGEDILQQPPNYVFDICRPLTEEELVLGKTIRGNYIPELMLRMCELIHEEYGCTGNHMILVPKMLNYSSAKNVKPDNFCMITYKDDLGFCHYFINPRILNGGDNKMLKKQRQAAEEENKVFGSSIGKDVFGRLKTGWNTFTDSIYSNSASAAAASLFAATNIENSDGENEKHATDEKEYSSSMTAASAALHPPLIENMEPATFKDMQIYSQIFQYLGLHVITVQKNVVLQYQPLIEKDTSAAAKKAAEESKQNSGDSNSDSGGVATAEANVAKILDEYSSDISHLEGIPPRGKLWLNKIPPKIVRSFSGAASHYLSYAYDILMARYPPPQPMPNKN